jgi:hypothetical protein
MGGLRFPEAEAEAKKYQMVLDTIERTRECIDNAADINSAGHISPSSVLDQTTSLYGEYYDIYTGRTDEWLQSALKIIDAFIQFQTSREFIYLEANMQYLIWQSRIGLTYPDPPESAP